MEYMLLEMQKQDAYLTQVAFHQLLCTLDIFAFCISSEFEYMKPKIENLYSYPLIENDILFYTPQKYAFKEI